MLFRGGHRLEVGLYCIIVLAELGRGLRAQELSLMGGAAALADLGTESYSWELDYRQYFLPQVAVSLDWINEGHLSEHHVDGFATEAWYCLPLDRGRLSLSVGAGPYFYFDTVLPPIGPSLDAHGFAPIYSAALTGYLGNRWFWRVMYNRINPPSNDIKVNTLDMGVGYWMGKGTEPPRIATVSPEEDPPFSPYNEVTPYVGWRVSNTRLNRQTMAEALEYRRDLSPHFDATASFIYEGDPAVVRRSGLAAQIWTLSRFPEQWGLSVGMGFGAYLYVDKKTAQPGGLKSASSVGGLVSPMISKRLGSSAWTARLLWNRIITNYDRDSDLWMVGYAWR